ncbi:MAG: hypothetical protein ACO4AJ_10175, partial [Prochlorothrix sp.]
GGPPPKPTINAGAFDLERTPPIPNLVMSPIDRARLKTQLHHSIAALGSQAAVLPTAEPQLKRPINGQVQALIAQNPTSFPLSPQNYSLLWGTWDLIYASQGTVVTRRLGQVQDVDSSASTAPVTLGRIWQVLSPLDVAETDRRERVDADRLFPVLRAENGAILQVPVLGEVKLCARGEWTVASPGVSLGAAGPETHGPSNPNTQATVTFHSFGLQGQAVGPLWWRGPELWLPVLPLLRRSALWRVVYCDADLYIGEGKTGNQFVFQRSA